jgi:hypothetical protein
MIWNLVINSNPNNYRILQSLVIFCNLSHSMSHSMNDCRKFNEYIEILQLFSFYTLINICNFLHNVKDYGEFKKSQWLQTLLENRDQINRKSTHLWCLGHCNDRFHWFLKFCKNQQIATYFLLIWIVQWPNQFFLGNLIYFFEIY